MEAFCQGNLFNVRINSNSVSTLDFHHSSDFKFSYQDIVIPKIFKSNLVLRNHKIIIR